MSTLRVTIVVPTHNRRRWIGECLDAIQAQTYRGFDVLIVDDFSTDGTTEWLRSEPLYSFAQIIQQPRNMGASEARNEGARRATGDLITFIDSDDLLEPNHLERAVDAFQRFPRVGLFCCDAINIGPNGEVLGDGRTWHEVNSAIKQYPVRTGIRALEDVFVFSNSFPGFTLRRDLLLKLGGLDQSLFPLDDYDLALRVAAEGDAVYYCHLPLARYRVHGTNASGAGNALKVAQKKLRTLELALERFPSIEVKLGDAVAQRLAEVEIELAVSHVYAGDRKEALRAVLRALRRDPSKLSDVLQLSSRWLRRRMVEMVSSS